MNRTLLVFGALLLAGCGLNEEKYASKYATAICSYYEECGYLEYAGGDIDTCEANQENGQLSLITSDACEYDPGAAKDCVDAVRAASCPTDDDTDGTNDFDAACSSVCGGGGGE